MVSQGGLVVVTVFFMFERVRTIASPPWFHNFKSVAIDNPSMRCSLIAGSLSHLVLMLVLVPSTCREGPCCCDMYQKHRRDFVSHVFTHPLWSQEVNGTRFVLSSKTTRSRYPPPTSQRLVLPL